MIEGLDDVFGDPNGPAYQKREERVGPPLTYVGEKLGNSLRAVHELARGVHGASNSDLPVFSATDSEIIAEYQRKVDAAFYYGLVAYLALVNMLALANESQLVERLVALSSDEFDEWLRGIEEGGSVTG